MPLSINNPHFYKLLFMKNIIPFLFLLALSVAFIAKAQTVNPKRSIGNCGAVTTVFNNSFNPIIKQTLLKPDGKIIAAGYGQISEFSGHYNTFIAQYNADGTPDISFGTNGQATISLAARTTCENFTLLPDGKIVGVGSDGLIPLIFRLNANGSVDNSFGDNGKTALLFDNISSGFFNNIIVLPDGKLLAGGSSRGGVYGPAMMKFNADGTLDNSFGNIPGFPGRARVTELYNIFNVNVNMLVQNDGKILLAYPSDVTSNIPQVNLEIVRFLVDGTVDNSFGTDGTLTASGINMEGSLSSAMQPDGKIIFSCTSNNRPLVLIKNTI